NLYALDAATGALKWKLPTGNDVRSTPLVANGLVYFGSADGVIYAVDQQGGTTRWTYKTGAAINRSSPTLANGLVYVSSEDAYVYGLDPQSGSLVQKFQTGGVIHSTPLVANGLLYVGSFDGYVYAFDVTR
ncbi:MAG TPA: PQQ-binding-like beta-propeller repeat protein, partial [Ktedonobacterales bacterium]